MPHKLLTLAIVTFIGALPVAACAQHDETPPTTSASSEAIEAPGPEGPLSGTLLRADAEDAPTALIIPGSGPTDRDGNSPLGIQASTYRLLAEGMAERGISSVRIDKRGMFGSEGAVADANAVTMDDYADDVHSWAETITAETGASCVWLLGHSEGGLVALHAAQQDAMPICGLVLVSTPGRPMGDVMRSQLRDNPANAPVLDDAMATIDALERGERVDVSGMHPALGQLFAPAVQGFLISAFQIDPAALIGATDLPVLIVQGARDLQVGENDAQLLAAADPEAELLIVDNANHVLKSVDSDNRGANMASYADPDLPLADGIVSGIVAFVRSHTDDRRADH